MSAALSGGQAAIPALLHFRVGVAHGLCVLKQQQAGGLLCGNCSEPSRLHCSSNFGIDELLQVLWVVHQCARLLRQTSISSSLCHLLLCSLVVAMRLVVAWTQLQSTKGACMVMFCFCDMPCCSCMLTGTSVQCTLGMLKRGEGLDTRAFYMAERGGSGGIVMPERDILLQLPIQLPILCCHQC